MVGESGGRRVRLDGDGRGRSGTGEVGVAGVRIMHRLGVGELGWQGKGQALMGVRR